MPRTLVTGATGFIGAAVCAELASRGMSVRATSRRPSVHVPHASETIWIDDIGPSTSWSDALASVEVVVHVAGRAHVFDAPTPQSEAELRRVNTLGSINLARQAAHARARRFVFISSIGVNGAETTTIPFSADDLAAPHSAYAASKHEAEVSLREIAAATGMEVVIIRPPMVIGPGAPGNFGRLLRAVHRRIPLPFATLRNQRSTVGLDNLADLIGVCCSNPTAANETFLVSDGADLSTLELVRLMGAALGRPARLFPMPAAALRFATRLVGKGEVGRQLCGSLQVDIGKTRNLLGWHPRQTTAAAVEQAAGYFLERLGT